MKSSVGRSSSIFSAIVMLGLCVLGQGSYKQPPKEVMDVLNAPVIPQTIVSPARDKILMLTPLRNPSIAELAQPMLRIAGLRINPLNNGLHRQAYFVKLSLKNIADGEETAVSLPPNAKVFLPQWSADGRSIAIGNITPNAIELWVIDTATGRAQQIKNAQLNTAFGEFGWMPNQRDIIANIVPKGRPAPPKYEDIVPTEPAIQETTGRRGAIQTFEDLLKNPNDEKLFEYYCTSQLAVISPDGRVREIGQPAIFETADVSPDGKYILTSLVHRPFSYQFPSGRFPHLTEVWDMNGKSVYKVADVPLQDQLPVGGVPTGPRSVAWIPTESATLVWTEALDGGDPRKKVTPRDRYVTMAAPFSGKPHDLLNVEQRAQGRALFGENGLMWFSDTNRDTQHRRIFIADYRNPSNVRLVSDTNVNDRYNEIGQPVMTRLTSGENVILQNGNSVYLTGNGASPDGDRPFLRQVNLATLRTSEVFRSGKDKYESFVAFNKPTGRMTGNVPITEFIVRRESPSEPPNLYLRSQSESSEQMVSEEPLTDFKDPSPQLRGITKQLVTYKRADGVDLSFTLYLPPGYKKGTRLPTVVWAYPLEFTDNSTAGQVSGSTNRFTQISGYSHLFFLLEGYAVLDNTTMPIVGDPLTVNDTYVEQVVSSAKSAIDKAVELGVTDPDRVGVGGHSYGAFMTANLLAHSDLFRAGIARSGAYNRTLTPFGFQNERRSFWEAPALYEKVSPFYYADKIKTPLLMIHGEADDNTGTFPIQSERMFAAISGNGGTARLVMLPLEAHGYIAKETTEHVLWEMINWFDKYVKNAKPRDAKQVTAGQ
jgi:dipeptidyl aminopeptidase/acylaminoacyl peptidase